MSVNTFIDGNYHISHIICNTIRAFLLACKVYQKKHNIIMVKYMRQKIIGYLLELSN